MKNAMLLLSMLAAGAALTLSAQDTPPQRPPGGPGFGPHGRGPGPHGPPPIIALLDADKDGVLSEAEINDAPAKLLTLDANKDGQLTLEEVCPRPPEAQGAPGQPQNVGKGARKGFRHGQGPMGPPPCMVLFDTNRDGTLSAEEIQNAPAALMALDENQDKQLSADELRPPRPMHDGPPPTGPEGGQSGQQQ